MFFHSVDLRVAHEIKRIADDGAGGGEFGQGAVGFEDFGARARVPLRIEDVADDSRGMQVRILNADERAFVEVESIEASVGDIERLREQFEFLRGHVDPCDSDPAGDEEDFIVWRESDAVRLATESRGSNISRPSRSGEARKTSPVPVLVVNASPFEFKATSFRKPSAPFAPECLKRSAPVFKSYW